MKLMSDFFLSTIAVFMKYYNTWWDHITKSEAELIDFSFVVSVKEGLDDFVSNDNVVGFIFDVNSWAIAFLKSL